MASSFFTLLDDIAMLADDVAVAAKQATAKTAGILGDDIAVGAEKATGFHQSREIHVIKEIAKGSLLNKIIILPLVFLFNYFIPIVIDIALVLGALYLVLEGYQGLKGWFEKKKKETQKEHQEHFDETHEKKKIKAAIKTDFILSIEIIVLALTSVSDKPFLTQSIATIFVALLATVGVYGLVALIVKMDDFGFWLQSKGKETIGQFFVSSLPILIKILSVVGVIAMFLVGGGILMHKISFLHFEFNSYIMLSLEMIVGVIAGFVVYQIEHLVMKILGKTNH
jgi:predicted DNA repair protein MutK